MDGQDAGEYTPRILSILCVGDEFSGCDMQSRRTMQSGTQLSYEGALRRVMGLADFERSTHSPGHSTFHLERMSLLMEELKRAHLAVPTVHIAGTKGKGSTSALTAAILTAHGYKVGLYTSPHLHSATERIRVDGLPVTQEEFAAVVERIWPVVERIGESGGFGGVTTFEAMTAMAFVHFRQIEADFQVMEVGLGGRLDSTNIVQPRVCAITSISLDHVATLGDTIAKIAFEKAGIIKEDVPVVVAPQTEEAMAVITDVAYERAAPLLSVEERFSWNKRRSDMRGQAFTLTTPDGAYELETPLIGDYQMENVATAVAVAETLRAQGVELDDASIVRGVREVHWPARLQVLATPEEGGKLLVVDGAHNPYSMERLVETLRSNFSYQRLILIFGALSGHSAAGMLRALVPLSPQVFATHSRHPRSASGTTVAQVAAELGMDVVFTSENVGETTRHALAMATENDLVLGTGSLSVAAEVTEEVQDIPPELYPYMSMPRR